jgi:hypothetical protein
MVAPCGRPFAAPNLTLIRSGADGKYALTQVPAGAYHVGYGVKV